MKNTLVPIALALSLAAFAPASSASAQTNLNQRTVLTFSQPVEVPGKVLPAGTYTFELNDSMANRHIVQIFDEAGTKVVALVLAVPSRRPTATGETVVNFAEVAAGQPQALRTWFYPGQTVGREMVYPRTRAQQLAVTANVVVPAVDDSFYADANVEAMKTAPVVVITPERTEKVFEPAPVATAPVAIAPVAAAPVDPAPVMAAEPRKELPETASALPLIALFGFASIAVGLSLRGIAARRASR